MSDFKLLKTKFSKDECDLILGNLLRGRYGYISSVEVDLDIKKLEILLKCSIFLTCFKNITDPDMLEYYALYNKGMHFYDLLPNSIIDKFDLAILDEYPIFIKTPLFIILGPSMLPFVRNNVLYLYEKYGRQFFIDNYLEHGLYLVGDIQLTKDLFYRKINYIFLAVSFKDLEEIFKFNDPTILEKAFIFDVEMTSEKEREIFDLIPEGYYFPNKKNTIPLNELIAKSTSVMIRHFQRDDITDESILQYIKTRLPFDCDFIGLNSSFIGKKAARLDDLDSLLQEYDNLFNLLACVSLSTLPSSTKNYPFIWNYITNKNRAKVYLLHLDVGDHISIEMIKTVLQYLPPEKIMKYSRSLVNKKILDLLSLQGRKSGRK